MKLLKDKFDWWNCDFISSNMDLDLKFGLDLKFRFYWSLYRIIGMFGGPLECSTIRLKISEQIE